jgi:hypothetical protein
MPAKIKLQSLDNLPKKPPDLMNGPDSGFGFGQLTLYTLDATGEALEPRRWGHPRDEGFGASSSGSAFRLFLLK